MKWTYWIEHTNKVPERSWKCKGKIEKDLPVEVCILMREIIIKEIPQLNKCDWRIGGDWVDAKGTFRAKSGNITRISAIADYDCEVFSRRKDEQGHYHDRFGMGR